MKINKKATKENRAEKEQVKHGHLNHMHGVSYDIHNPIKQLRIVASSCFFGEPMYYHDDTSKEVSSVSSKENLYGKYLSEELGSVISIPEYHKYSASKLVETSIDAALDYDAEKTLQEAVRLRNEENMRVTPQVIMVRAANHPKIRGTGLVKKYASQILVRTDEAATQLAYQTQVYGRPIPNALKKAWKVFLEKCSEYQLAKYRLEAKAFKTLDVVNLVHAHSDAIDKLMKGTLKLDNATWESNISQNGSTKENWEKSIDLMGHMALLRNIANFEKNGVSPDKYIDKLIETAASGKQLPFRYFSAYKAAESANVSGRVLDAIETCLEESIGRLPRFEGRVMSLCDNSGSAHGAFTSTAGTMTVAQIANLTAILTGKASDDGYIGIFGDKLEVKPVRKKDSVFTALKEANSIGKGIGAGTENGVWLFFDQAIKNKEHWDSIFVYSDMQAGHGGLYGTTPSQYRDYIWEASLGRTSGRHIDVAKLVKTYRKEVNPNVKVFLVQVAGYKDTLVPEFYDKTYILGGWGDGLLRFAKEMSSLDQQS